MLKCASRLLSDCGGAVAPTVALSLIGLIAAGGIAFDYARLATMDTELQSAADQAALAAATQLDGETDACTRAAAAAAGLLTNNTLFANEPTSTSVAVTVPASSGDECAGNGFIEFYQSYDQAADTFGPLATAGTNARVVLVRVAPREAFYALTPVVAAVSSGDVQAEAIASLGSAICKTPPVMMCNPAEPESNTDPNFAFNPNEGEGLRLVIGSPDAPGNFGFLRTEESGAKGVAKMLGYDNPPSGCIAVSGVDTEPGNMISVRAAFNTRFDISENGETTCPDGGVCSPSENSRKDLVRASGDGCALGNSDWREADNPYRAPDATTPLDGTSDPDIMGYPRDMCHAWSLLGSCSGGIIGDGVWDIDAYFRVNYTWTPSQWFENTKTNTIPLAATPAEVTRYDVYLWEMANPGQVPVPQPIGATGVNGYARPVCRAPGIIPNPPTTPDRRRISVAVVNCHAQDLKGAATNVIVVDWLDVFLVEPALARGNGPSQRSTNGDIYVEVIEKAGSSGTATNQITRRDVPYLIR
ncbi:MAG TPA: pilus assembly protein TadG-related protein [Sphingomicrobium sp.]|nr:pilus assembly protein TadG-related protein [Sphingomicrobium sp.]